MKELFVLLKESLIFYKETLGNPDPSQRPSLRVVITIMLLATVLMFTYTYSGIMLEMITTPRPSYVALEQEAVELRVELNRTKRMNASCSRDRDELVKAYNTLLESIGEVPVETDGPISTDEFFDRLGELN